MSPELWQRFVVMCDAVVRGQAALVQLPGPGGPLGIVCVLSESGEVVEAQPVGLVFPDCRTPFRFERPVTSRFEPGRN
jgi:hypothetical protein